MVSKKTLTALASATKVARSNIGSDPFLGSKKAQVLVVQYGYNGTDVLYTAAFLRTADGLWFTTVKRIGGRLNWRGVLTFLEGVDVVSIQAADRWVDVSEGD